MFDVHLKKTGKNGQLTLKGSLTYENAGAVKKALLKGLDKYKTLLLTFEEVEKVDLTTFQLLCAAHKSALERKKNIILERGLPAALNQAAVELGFTRHAGCRKETKDTCFFIENEAR
jgi:anti-anti-sigma regulatory factor